MESIIENLSDSMTWVHFLGAPLRILSMINGQDVAFLNGMQTVF
jgi:hypothetical protein